MSLNLLTRGTIRSEYKLLKSHFTDKMILGEEISAKVEQFFQEFEDTFLYSNVWEVHEWCVAGLRVRTNNDMESKKQLNLV